MIASRAVLVLAVFACATVLLALSASCRVAVESLGLPGGQAPFDQAEDGAGPLAPGGGFIPADPGGDQQPAGGEYAADALYAIPDRGAAAVGEAVTVVVATGVPDSPFRFMNGCGLTIEEDADFVRNSFNVGEPGGAPDTVDGLWAAMDPAEGFLMPPDNFIRSTSGTAANGIGVGRERWDFNVTPLEGTDLSGAEGALFNCQFTFAAAGVKTFGFQRFSGVNRTYYSDWAGTDRFWGDLSNDHEGFAHSVAVQ